MNSHRFLDVERERRKWQNPEAILIDIGLKAGSIFVDVGCGAGFFTLPAARLVGSTGKVYALDVDSQALNRLKRKASEESLKNILFKIGRAEDMVFCNMCADIVFFGIVLHDFNDPVAVIQNALKMLKSTGRLVDLDWKKQPMPVGPPLDIRFSQDEASRLIHSAGFRIREIKQVGPYQYKIIATPKPEWRAQLKQAKHVTQ